MLLIGYLKIVQVMIKNIHDLKEEVHLMMGFFFYNLFFNFLIFSLSFLISPFICFLQ